MSGDVILLIFDITVVIALLGTMWTVQQLRSRIEALSDYARANHQDIASLKSRQLDLEEDVRKVESDIQPDVANTVVKSYDMSKIKATTAAPLKILSFQKHPQVTVSMLDEASYVREFGKQRDTGETTITIGVKHD